MIGCMPLARLAFMRLAALPDESCVLEARVKNTVE